MLKCALSQGDLPAVSLKTYWVLDLTRANAGQMFVLDGNFQVEVFPSVCWLLQYFWLRILLENGFGNSPAEIENGVIEMMDLKSLVSDEQKLKQRIARLQANLARKEVKKKEAVRQLDSRRKIILGGVLIAAVRAGGISENSVRKLVAEFASDQDRKALGEFQFESSAG